MLFFNINIKNSFLKIKNKKIHGSWTCHISLVLLNIIEIKSCKRLYDQPTLKIIKNYLNECILNLDIYYGIYYFFVDFVIFNF